MHKIRFSEDNLYTNLWLLLLDQCLYTLKIAIFEGKEKIQNMIYLKKISVKFQRTLEKIK